MTDQDIRTITLRVNSDDASKKLDALRSKLDAARLSREKSLALEEQLSAEISRSASERSRLNALLKSGTQSDRDRALTAERLARITSRLAEEERALSRAKAETARQSRAVSLGERSLARSEGQYRALSRTLGQLSRATVPELRQSIRLLERTLHSGAVERGTKEWGIFERQLRDCRTELLALEQASRGSVPSSGGASSWGQKWLGFTGTLTFGSQLLDRLSGSVGRYVDEFASMQEAMAGVSKYTDLSAASVTALNDDFRRMDTRTPRTALNLLAADAGRLGIQGRGAVLDFVQAADRINVALGADLGADAVKNIGKLTQLFGEDTKQGLRQGMLATASVVNELAQSSSAAEPYLVEFTSRVAGVGRTAGIALPELMSYAAVLDQGMVGAERGATALQNILTALFRKPAEFASAAGLEVKAFTQLLRTDANAALLSFVEGLHRRGGLDSIAPMLDAMQLSGSGVTQVLTTLSGRLDTLRSTQVQASRAFSEATSVEREYAKANSTVQASLEKSRARFADARIELGERLLPVYSQLLEATSSGARGLLALGRVLSAHRGLVGAVALAWGVYWLAQQRALITEKASLAVATARTVLQRTAVGLYALETVAVNAVRLAYFRLTGQTAAATVAQQALNVALKANPFGALLTVVSLLAGAYALFDSRSRELSQTQAGLSSIREKAMSDMAEERTRIDLLRRAAMDETQTLDARRRAVEQLNAIIPDYNASLDATTGKYTESAAALSSYLSQLQRKYELEGARAELVELGRQRAAALTEVDDARAAWRSRREQNAQDDWTNYIPFVVPVRMALEARAGSRLQAAKKAVSELDRRRDALLSHYGADLTAVETVRGASSPPASGGSSSSASSSRSSGSSSRSSGASSRALAAIDREAEESRQRARLSYASGQTDALAHRERLLEIERTTLLRRRALYAVGSADYVRAQQALDEHERTRQERRRDWSLSALEQDHKEQLQTLETHRAAERLSEEEALAWKEEITLDYLRRRADLLRRDGAVEEHLKAEQSYRDESHRQSLEKQRRFWEKIKTLREEYARKTPEEVMQLELSQLEELHRSGAVAEEEYQQLLRRIRLKYRGADGRGGILGDERRARAQEALRLASGDEGEEAGGGAVGGAESFAGVARAVGRLSVAESTYRRLRELRAADLISAQQHADALAHLDEQRFARFCQAAESAYAFVGAAMSTLSAHTAAQARADESAVSAQYDARIRAAEGNAARVKKLEAEKEAAIAQIKNKANRRAMTMEMAQAAASTAMAALNAYRSTVAIPLVGKILAPIAAASALAFGAVQMATIRKQHEAQSKGFYSGGFTGGRNPRRVAGVVHEGEFVANHQAVRNPAVLPVLELLDHAQRHNTVASLTSSDVARALSGPSSPSASGVGGSSPVQVVSAESPATLAVLERLASTLEQGIAATVALDGQDGLVHGLDRYRRLASRK